MEFRGGCQTDETSEVFPEGTVAAHHADLGGLFSGYIWSRYVALEAPLRDQRRESNRPGLCQEGGVTGTIGRHHPDFDPGPRVIYINV